MNLRSHVQDMVEGDKLDELDLRLGGEQRAIR